MRVRKLIFTAFLALICCFPFAAWAAETGTAPLPENARVVDGHMTSAMKDGKPLDRLIAYTQESPAFYAAGTLLSAPPNTKIRFSWFFATDNRHITDVELNTENHGSDIFVYSTLNNGGDPWPKGAFRVEIFVNDRSDPDQIIDFEVE